MKIKRLEIQIDELNKLYSTPEFSLKYPTIYEGLKLFGAMFALNIILIIILPVAFFIQMYRHIVTYKCGFSSFGFVYRIFKGGFYTQHDMLYNRIINGRNKKA